MTQGIFVNYERPKSQKAVKEAILSAPETVTLEATSFFGNEYDGPIADMPENKTVYVVIPSPQDRKTFMNITRVGDKFTFNK